MTDPIDLTPNLTSTLTSFNGGKYEENNLASHVCDGHSYRSGLRCFVETGCSAIKRISAFMTPVSTLDGGKVRSLFDGLPSLPGLRRSAIHSSNISGSVNRAFVCGELHNVVIVPGDECSDDCGGNDNYEAGGEACLDHWYCSGSACNHYEYCTCVP